MASKKQLKQNICTFIASFLLLRGIIDGIPILSHKRPGQFQIYVSGNQQWQTVEEKPSERDKF